MLNTTIRIRDLALENRLVLPPMATEKSGNGGTVTKELCDYYAEKTGDRMIGLVIIEHSFISQEGKASPAQLSIAGDQDIAGLAKLVEIIHGNGSRVFAQLNHAGGAASEAVTGCRPMAPSAVPMPNRETVPREMSRGDIEKVISDFAGAAVRARSAGFDGVELHSAHGYLLNQFYSPLTNRRTDAYGGTLDGRIRLHLEVIKAVRDAVGGDCPIALRLGACDYQESGTTKEDSVKAAKAFEQAGVDVLDISGGFCRYTNPYDKSEGYFSELSEAVRQAVSIPVILTGGIVRAQTAERLLREGKADLIGVGRAILKDSHWAKNEGLQLL